MKKNDIHFATRALHSDRKPELQQGFVNTPIYRGSTVVFDTVDEFEQSKNNRDTLHTIFYGRYGNPISFAFENAIANLENGYAGLSVSSGLAAIATSLMALVKNSDHLLVSDNVYPPTREFCNNVLVPNGVAVTYYDPMTGGHIENLIRDNTRCIFLESPGSQTFEVQDVPLIADIARKHGIITVIDNSWATPCFFRPLDHGVNISVTAATKYIVGHTDAMLGIIVTDREHYPVIRKTWSMFGQCASPDDIFLGLRGLRTLVVRMDQHHRQGLKLANWLKSQPDVLRVLHPGLEDCPGHDIWKRDFSGASGLFSFEIEKRSKDAVAEFVNHLDLFSIGASWGGYESLLIPVDPSTHRTIPNNQDPHQMFRIHAGLEHIDDLIVDLAAGLIRYRNHS